MSDALQTRRQPSRPWQPATKLAVSYFRSSHHFCRELAPRLGVSVPTAVYAAIAAKETDFVLLMEDLAPARQVDQLIGCTEVESALVLEQAAALHAATWPTRQASK